MAKKPTPLELSITRAIDRHYRKDRDLRVADIRLALKNVDRTLLVLLTGDVPSSPLAPAFRNGKRSKRKGM